MAVQIELYENEKEVVDIENIDNAIQWRGRYQLRGCDQLSLSFDFRKRQVRP